jgi:hypothetical protein
VLLHLLVVDRVALAPDRQKIVALHGSVDRAGSDQVGSAEC